MESECAAAGSRPNLTEVFFTQIMSKNEIVLVVIISEALCPPGPIVNIVNIPQNRNFNVTQT